MSRKQAVKAGPKGELKSAQGSLRTRSLESLLSLELPPRESLLGTWLTERHLSMVYAAAGVGKSMFAMSIALAVGGGGKYLGWEAPQARKVLYVDGEMDIADLQERSKLLMEAVPKLDRKAAERNVLLMAQQDQQPGVRFPDLATEEGREAILKVAGEHEVKLVILDNLSTLATVEDENAAASFDPIIDLMKQLKLQGSACLLVHHSRKHGGNRGYRGTSKMEVTFNSIVALHHPAGIPSTNGTAFELSWEKYRGLQDGTIKPLKVRLQHGRKPCWEHETGEDQRIPELVAMVKSMDYASQRELAEAMGVSLGLVNKLKAKAIAQGLIRESAWEECFEQARKLREDAKGAGEAF